METSPEEDDDTLSTNQTRQYRMHTCHKVTHYCLPVLLLAGMIILGYVIRMVIESNRFNWEAQTIFPKKLIIKRLLQECGMQLKQQH